MVSVNNTINKTTINIILKDLRKLLQDAKDWRKIKTLKNNIRSYEAVKVLLDTEE